MRYNWARKDWPNFTYNLQELEDVLFEITERMGRVTGLIKALPEKLQDEALQSMGAGRSTRYRVKLNSGV